MSAARQARRGKAPATPRRDWSDWVGDRLTTRFPYGLAVLALGAFTLLSLLSPNGSLTRPWADRAIEIFGWGTVPLSLLLMIASVAILRGPGVGTWLLSGRLLAALGSGIALTALLAVSVGTDAEYPWRWLAALATFGEVPAAAVEQAFGRFGGLLMLCVVALLGGGASLGISVERWRQVGHALVVGAISFARLAAWGLWYLGRGVLIVLNLVGVAALAAGRGFQAWAAARVAERERMATEAEPQGQLVAADSLPSQSPQVVFEPAEAPAPSPAVAADPVAEAPVAPPDCAEEAPQPRWQLPSTATLASASAQQISAAETDTKARVIEETLAAFNVPVQVVETRVGPTVSQFGLRPAPGITVQRIKRLQDDLMLALAAPSLRVETPVPGRPVVGIEIPNSGIAVVGLREVLESKPFAGDKGLLKIALGRDVEGNPRLGDLAKMPHLLIAGQTGSGKSVCINTIVASLLYQGTPDTLQLLMIDPKMVELVEYEGIPHLRYPVVVELTEAAKVLLWAVEEMERRYRLLKEAGYRNIQTYNHALADADQDDGDESAEDVPQPLPYLVLIIDELADLMMFAPDDVEPAICRLTAKSRAVGIHLVVATQRPSVDVVTGLIKANMPSRIAFAVSSQTDSRVILDTGGAENLLGRGDMLYLPYDSGRAARVQCAYVSDEEITGLVEFWKAQGTPDYVDEEEIAHLQLKEDEAPETARENPELDMALGAIEELDYTSVSWLQRKLGIGYPKAARLMDDLVERGIVVKEDSPGRSYRVVPGAPFAALRGEWETPGQDDDNEEPF